MKSSSRLQVVDALRGFAIISILLLHNIEHFDFYFTALNTPAWLVPVDKAVWNTMFFMFGGKSYAIFSLLFGLTYFIQDQHQLEKGADFRTRFVWRLFLLLGFGLINSAFFEGDILSIYAILGLALIPVTRLKSKHILIIASVLMLQPYEWGNFVYGLYHPDLKLADPLSWQYFGKMNEYIPADSFLNTAYGNLTNGKIAVWLWSWEAGRIFQTISLFMFGFLAGRKHFFESSAQNAKFWRKVLLYSVMLFVPLFIIKENIIHWITAVSIHRPLQTIFTSWSNMAFMLLLVSGFYLLFRNDLFNKFLSHLSPIGQMSMTNYLLQSLLGSFIYYGFGLGLYQYTGPTYAIGIGVILALLQLSFSKWWMKRYSRGPLETIWHRLTWIKSV